MLKGSLPEAMYAPPAIAQTHVAAHEKCIAADNNYNKWSGVDDDEEKMLNEKRDEAREAFSRDTQAVPEQSNQLMAAPSQSFGASCLHQPRQVVHCALRRWEVILPPLTSARTESKLQDTFSVAKASRLAPRFWCISALLGAMASASLQSVSDDHILD